MQDRVLLLGLWFGVRGREPGPLLTQYSCQRPVVFGPRVGSWVEEGGGGGGLLVDKRMSGG